MISRRLSPDDFYPRLFAPVSPPGHPSGFRHPPRPFVFRAAHLDGQHIAPGDTFHFGLPLFDLRDLPATVAHLSAVFEALKNEGMGPHRGRAELTGITGADPVSLPLAPPPVQPMSRVVVEFRTPTELKSGGVLIPEPVFPVLFDRLRDRISALTTFYGPEPLAFDWNKLSATAAQIQSDGFHLRTVARQRRSSRTGQQHPLSGFIGTAEYSGDLTPFWPWLEAAQWTGVGRQTVWGKGEIHVRAL